MLEFRINYANQLQRDSQHMQAIIQHDVVHESILGRLESLVTHFVGVGPSNDGNPEFGAAQQQQQAPQALEPSVQSLTFESFVGEVPPQVPPESASSSRHSSFQQRTASFGAQQQQSYATAPPNEFFGNFDQQAFSQQFQPPPPPPQPMSPASSNPWDDFAAQSAPVHPVSSFPPAQEASPWSTFDDAAKPQQTVDPTPPPPPAMRQMPSFHKLHAEASLGIM